jgi:putative cell wall-binding protein
MNLIDDLEDTMNSKTKGESMKKARRFMALLVALLLALGMVPAMGFAADTGFAPLDDEVVFTVYTQEGEDGTPVMAKEYTQVEFEALVDVTEPTGYLSWQHSKNWGVYATDNAIKVATLLEDAGLVFASGDELKVVASTDGFSYTINYQDWNGGQFYPATTATGEDIAGGYEVVPVIALSAGSAAIASTAAATIDAAIAENMDHNRFLIGVKEANYLDRQAAGKRFVDNVGSITLITPPPIASFALYTQVSDGPKQLVKLYSYAQLTALAQSTPRGFLMFRNGAWAVHASNKYIPIDDLLADANITFAPGDSLSPRGADGFGATFSYEQIQAEKFFYPATSATSTDVDGAVEVGAVLALDWNSAGITSTASAALSEALLGELANTGRFYIGLSEENYLAGSAAGNRLVTAPVEITIVSPAVDTSWTRLSGEDRYDTMKDIISHSFTSSDTDTVIVATGENFPDALAASGLAGIVGAPVILTESATLSAQAKATIEALEPSTIYIAGGPGSVTPAVEDSLKALIDDPAKVIRSAGDDRYLTALDIYAEGKDAGSWGTTAIIASGGNYADALAISPYAYAERAPIFLADPDEGLDAATVQALKDALAAGDITHFIIAGGTGSVPDNIKFQLGYAVGDETVFTRLAGEDRYETSVAVADYTTANTVLGYHQLAVATGEDFPDALAGGAFAGKIGTTLLLVADTAAGRAGIESVVAENSAAIGYGYVLGGPGTVSDSLKTALEEASRD